MEANENIEIVKLNQTKEIVVNVNNIEDLLNSISYANSMLKKSKEIVESKDLIHNINTVKATVDSLISRLDNLHETEFPKLKKEVAEVGKKLPSDGLLKSLHFEIEKISGLDMAFKKQRGWHILISIITSALCVTAILMFTKLDDEILKKAYQVELQKNNWVISKQKFEIQSKTNDTIVLKIK